MSLGKKQIIQISIMFGLTVVVYAIVLHPSVSRIRGSRSDVSRKKEEIVQRKVIEPPVEKMVRSFQALESQIDSVYNSAIITQDSQFDFLQFLEIKAQEHDIEQKVFFNLDQRISDIDRGKVPVRLEIVAPMDKLQDYLRDLEISEYYLLINSILIRQDFADKDKLRTSVSCLVYVE